MRVLVPEIPEEGLMLCFAGGDARWDGLAGMEVESLPEGQVFLERRGQDVFLKGQVSACLRLACGRCLESYPFTLDVSFRHTLRPLQKEMRGVREVELVREDLEYGCYEGDTIELDRLIEEHVLLGLPMKPLCRDDCKGICSRCGANRNEGSCTCALDEAESPFNVLKTRVL